MEDTMIKPKQSKPLIKDNTYFSKRGFKLLLGDSLVLLDSLPEASFDMIFADPPYMLSNDGFTVHAGKMVSVNKGKWDKSKGFEEDFEFHKLWIQKCKRLLKPNGTIWISGTYHSIYQCGFALQLNEYHILNDIAWFKPNASPNLSGRYFTASHETLIWARKDKKAKHYFDYKASKEGEWPEDALKKPGLQMRSVWSIHPPKKEEKVYGKHPTQKPLNLLKRIITTSTKPDDLILDPFNGGGTTGIAAAMLKRRYVGIDLDRHYLDVTIKRYGDV